MLREIISYLITPAPGWARKYGLLKESIAIEARYKRNKKAWGPHLEKTKAFIRQYTLSSPKKNRVAILGSGGLLDVPLPDLAGHFEEVLLVDAIHPRKARRFARQFPNVRFIECDLSSPDPGTVIFPALYVVVSCNLLSQLPLPFAQSQRHHIIVTHLQWLKMLAPRALLICETRQTLLTHDHQFVEDFDMLGGLTPSDPLQEWIWTMAPKGELKSGLILQGHVSAFLFDKKQ